MLSSGDVVVLDLGVPHGREAGFSHPAVVVTAQRILDAIPSVVQVVPLTSRLRGFHSEVVLDADEASGLSAPSAAQCQHLRAVSTRRVDQVLGNVGPAALRQVRETIAVIIDL
jgi:mRNA interferase MazF